jgi:hypothetical protein
VLLSLVLLALAASVPCSCAGPATRHVTIARGVEFDLLPPHSLQAAISLEQLVDVRHGERTGSFHCLLEVDSDQLVLVGLTPFGTRAFVLTLRNDELDVEMGPVPELPAPPERILADLQLALWPTLPPLPGLTVVDSRDADAHQVREFRRGDVVVIRVTIDNDVRWKGSVRFEHLEQGYELNVRTLRAEELAP